MAGALVAHAVAFACLAAAHAKGDAGRGSPPVEVEIEEVLSAATPSAAREPIVPTPNATKPAAATSQRTLSRGFAVGASVPASSVLAPPSSSSGEPAPLDFSGPVHLSADALGLGGRNVFLGHLPDGPPPSAPTAPDGTPDVAPGIDRSMRDALGARDHALGLDVGGPLVGVAKSVTRGSDTPVDSRALFEVTADDAGRITSVRLVDASAGEGAWQRVAARFAGAMRGQRLTMRGHKGAVITLTVASRWTLPSGNRAGKPVGDAQAVDPGTGAGCDFRGSGCYSSNSFDVTDIGSKPARQVHASILGERYL